VPYEVVCLRICLFGGQREKGLRPTQITIVFDDLVGKNQMVTANLLHESGCERVILMQVLVAWRYDNLGGISTDSGAQKLLHSNRILVWKKIIRGEPHPKFASFTDKTCHALLRLDTADFVPTQHDKRELRIVSICEMPNETSSPNLDIVGMSAYAQNTLNRLVERETYHALPFLHKAQGAGPLL